MNWGAVAAIAELLAALGVLASLLYLAHQIKQNTRVGMSVARQGISNLAVDGGALLAGNSEVSELFHRAITGGHLEGHEKLRLQALCYTLMRQYENIHYQYESGMLSEKEWQGFRENLKLFFAMDVWRKYWRQDERLFSPALRAQVDVLVAELESEPQPRSVLMSELSDVDLPQSTET